MEGVQCRECNEINDYNACKCENCKAVLSDVSCSDVDENEFLFIEEAESRGQVFGWISPGGDALLPQEEIKVEQEVNGNTIIIENYQLHSETPFNVQRIGDLKFNAISNSFNSGRDESDSLYKCSYCIKSFKRLASLKAHVNYEHLDDTECFDDIKCKTISKSDSYISPVCSEDSDSEYEPPIEEIEYKQTTKSPQKSKRIHDYSPKDNTSFNTPLKINSNSNSSLSSPTDEWKPNKSNSKRTIVYKCKACEKISSNYEEHKKHIVIHTVPEESLTETTSLEQLQKTPSGFLKCNLCEEVFVNERDHSNHQKLHQGRELLQCDICNAFLSTKSSLQKHKKRVHKELSPKVNRLFECIVCNQKFEAMILMVQHRKTHTDAIKKLEEMTIIKKDDGKTVYVCKVCAKTSKNKYRHEEHLRVHTKEKPFQCDKCEKRISTAAALMHHLRLHENDRPYTCDICSSTYRHKKSLKKHLRLHTGEKPFKCRCCDKTFAFNYTRADHERNIHFGESKARKRRKRLSEMEDACEVNDMTTCLIACKSESLTNAESV